MSKSPICTARQDKLTKVGIVEIGNDLRDQIAVFADRAGAAGDHVAHIIPGIMPAISHRKNG